MICFVVFPIVFVTCVDPVEPEFEFRDGIVFVEGFVSTNVGASFVSISESVTDFGVYKTTAVTGATVSFKNTNTGEIVLLTENIGSYVPPANFEAAVGETWELDIIMSDGAEYVSTPETILEPVVLSDINVSYNPELLFREASGKFVPGHSVSVSFDDPGDQENYYYWTWRSFENLDICEICKDGIFRNGACVPYSPPGTGPKPYYNYLCDTECWKIRFPESISIFDDQLTNGKTTSDLSVGNVLLYTKEDIVIEVQQFTLTPAAHKYFKVLKDVVDNNSGFNAPPPAALVGNMRNLGDDEEFVLGRFTAASTSVKSIFVDRTSIEESALENPDAPIFEGFMETPAPQTVSVPCSEKKHRTSFEPLEWVEQ